MEDVAGVVFTTVVAPHPPFRDSSQQENVEGDVKVDGSKKHVDTVINSETRELTR